MPKKGKKSKEPARPVQPVNPFVHLMVDKPYTVILVVMGTSCLISLVTVLLAIDLWPDVFSGASDGGGMDHMDVRSLQYNGYKEAINNVWVQGACQGKDDCNPLEVKPTCPARRRLRADNHVPRDADARHFLHRAEDPARQPLYDVAYGHLRATSDANFDQAAASTPFMQPLFQQVAPFADAGSLDLFSRRSYTNAHGEHSAGVVSHEHRRLIQFDGVATPICDANKEEDCEWQQTKRSDMMFAVFKDKEGDGSNLLTAAGIKEIKRLQNLMWKHKDHSKFCIRDIQFERSFPVIDPKTKQQSYGNTTRAGDCSMPTVLTNYFYPQDPATDGVHGIPHPNCVSQQFFYSLAKGFHGISMRNMNSMLMKLLSRLSDIHDLHTGTHCVKEYASLCSNRTGSVAKATELLTKLETDIPAAKSTLQKAYNMSATGTGLDWAELYGDLMCAPLTNSNCMFNATTRTGTKSMPMMGCGMTNGVCKPNTDAQEAAEWGNFQCLSNGKGKWIGDSKFDARLAQVVKYWATPHTKMFLSFFFDKNFSKDNTKSKYSRGIFLFGMPQANYKIKGSRGSAEYLKQTDVFVDWFQSNVRGDLMKTKTEGPVETLYLVASVTFGEILDLIIIDMLLAIVSFSFVFLWMWFATGSLLLSFMGMTEMLLCLPMAYFVYTHVLGFKYFDFMCALSLYIIMAIGADDVFIWVDAYKQSAYQPEEISGTLKTRFAWAWGRASYAMLITSLTTFAAFMGTSLSPLLEIKSFGIFVAFAIIIDYAYVISWLPAFTVVFHRHFEHAGFCKCRCPDGCIDKCGFCPCAPMVDDNAHLDAEEAAEQDMRALEKIFDGPVTKLVTHPILKIVFVVGGLAYLIPFGIMALDISPATESAQILPEDHPMQKLITIFGTEFPISGQDPKVRIDVIYGINKDNALDRSGIVALREPKNPGIIQWDSKFDWNKMSTQAHLKSVCETVSVHVAQSCADDAECKSLNPTKSDSTCVKSTLQNGQKALKGTCKCPSVVGESCTMFLAEEGRDNVDCIVTKFEEWVTNPKGGNTTFPVNPNRGAGKDANALMHEFIYSHANTYMSKFEGETVDYVGFDEKTCNVKFLKINFAIGMNKKRWYLENELRRNYDAMEAWMDAQNVRGGDTIGYQVDSDPGSKKWVWMNTQALYVSTALRGVGFAVLLSFGVLLIGTHNFITAVCATATIGFIILNILGGFVMIGWELGNMESICLVILAGFCVDYIVHLTHAFMESEDKSDRNERVHDAMKHMGVSVISGCITSLGAAAPLFFCSLQFFKIFGTFFFATILLAWTWANFFLMPLLALVGPEEYFGELFFWVKREPSSSKKDLEEEKAEEEEMENPLADAKSGVSVDVEEEAEEEAEPDVEAASKGSGGKKGKKGKGKGKGKGKK